MLLVASGKTGEIMISIRVHQMVDTFILWIVESGEIPGIQYMVIDSKNTRYVNSCGVQGVLLGHLC